MPRSKYPSAFSAVNNLGNCIWSRNPLDSRGGVLVGKLFSEILRNSRRVSVENENFFWLFSLATCCLNFGLFLVPARDLHREGSHKKENFTKRIRCYHCSSEKQPLEDHKCLEEECLDGAQTCPYLPKGNFMCYTGPHNGLTAES